MLVQFIKKQVLLMLRNKQELIILLAMPFLLISILGFALGKVMNQGKVDIHAKLAVVEHGNEKEDFSLFLNELKALPIPIEQQQNIAKLAESMLPIATLKNIFDSEELQKVLEIDNINENQLEQIRRNDDYTAILEIPKHFSYHLLKNIFLQNTEKPELTFFVNEGKEISAQLIEDIIQQFQEQYTLMSALGKNGMLSDSSFSAPNIDIEGKIETVSKSKPINSFTYYTVGMGVMFVLYIASYMATFAYREKQTHVFNRILLANVQKSTYIFSIFLSGFLLAFTQLIILFGLASFVYRVEWGEPFSFLTVTLFLSLAVGSLAVFVTSLNYRFNSENGSNIFTSVIVSIFAFLGGSYFPVGQISEFLQSAGDLTPNGAGLTAYLKILQGYGLNETTDSLIALTVFTIVILCFGLLVFPKRGETI